MCPEQGSGCISFAYAPTSFLQELRCCKNSVFASKQANKLRFCKNFVLAPELGFSEGKTGLCVHNTNGAQTVQPLSSSLRSVASQAHLVQVQSLCKPVPKLLQPEPCSGARARKGQRLLAKTSFVHLNRVCLRSYASQRREQRLQPEQGSGCLQKLCFCKNEVAACISEAYVS